MSDETCTMSPDTWVAIFTGLLWVTTAILAIYTARLWSATKSMSEEAKRTASQQAIDMEDSLRISRQSAYAAKRSADAAIQTIHNMQIGDRAYVKMSHTEPGLTLMKNETTEWYRVEVKIENCGKTPALVTEVRLRYMVCDWDQPLPRTIAYPSSDDANRQNSAFLVPGEFFFMVQPSPMDKPVRISNDSKRLILFGYIDYTDAFGQRHRAGYAREYRTVKGNNLFLIATKGYNYDRPRKETDSPDEDIIEQ